MESEMRGFTLIELLVTISIISILIVIASLQAVSWIRESTVSENRDMLLADIEDVKLKSLTGYPQGIFVIGGVNTSYSVRKLTDADFDFMRDGGEANTTLRTANLPSPLKIRLNGGDDELWFDRKGVPRTSGWSPQGRTFTVWHDSDHDNAVDAGEVKQEIILSSRGRIQYEK